VLNHLAVAKNNGMISVRVVDSEDPAADAEISLDEELAILSPGKAGK
jgi:hypothetical protein